MDNYPQKPQVAPQTGRVSPEERVAAKFLEGVSTSELRQMFEFRQNHVYLFLRKHIESKIRKIEVMLGCQREYAKDPLLLAEEQGKIKGMRAFDTVLSIVEAEYKRRVKIDDAQED